MALFQTSEMGYSVGGNILPNLDLIFSGTFLRNDDLKIGRGKLFQKILDSDQVELFPATGTVKEYQILPLRRRNGTQLGYRSNSLLLYRIPDIKMITGGGYKRTFFFLAG